eukprot:3012453-Prymnesium_polylepis.1
MYEVLTIHTTFDAKNARRIALLDQGATSQIRPPRAATRHGCRFHACCSKDLKPPAGHGTILHVDSHGSPRT